MTFSSLTFIVFFLIVYSVILLFNAKWITNRISEKAQLRWKHSILLIASYIFYGWWDFRFCALMLLLTVIAWFCARQIHVGAHPKLFLFIGVFVPLAVLGFFKYFNFFISSFTDLFGIDHPGTLAIILPVGISFYTFQSMSYTIDVHRKRIAYYSLPDVALYIAFFPQLVAGPIVKAEEFMPQLSSNHKLKLSDLSEGIQIFVFGLFKKLVIADNLSVFVDDVFEKPLAFSSISVILAIISYSIQIYCDFSGYSDMAIGIAKCFGYRFKNNFDLPYISKNVTEFWKRWHISLSSWLQEYLYIPLGGNRHGKIRTYLNLLITMVLGGLWHGASYTFLLWGFLHGIALCAHKLFMRLRKNRQPSAIGSVCAAILTYCFVCLCWVFFRADSIGSAMIILRKVFVWSAGINQIFSWSIISILLLAIATIAAYLRSRKQGSSSVHGYYVIMDLNKISSLIILFTIIGLILGLAYTNANPFIYFQF